MNTPELILPKHTFHDDLTSFSRTQEITDDFLKRNAEARHESTLGPARDFHRIASIPTVVVDQWMRDGFNIFEASAKEIVAKLKQQDNQAFLTTRKAI